MDGASQRVEVNTLHLLTSTAAIDRRYINHSNIGKPVRICLGRAKLACVSPGGFHLRPMKKLLPLALLLFAHPACGENKTGDSAPATSLEQETAAMLMNNSPQIQELFEAGVDDVVHVPIHLREIIARTAAIARRNLGDLPRPSESGIRVFYNGRDPEIGGQ